MKSQDDKAYHSNDGIISPDEPCIGAQHCKLAAALEQAADPIMITTADGNIEYVNAAFETVTGYSKQEVLGRTPQILKSGHHDAAFYHRLWETLNHGEVFREVFINRRKDGSLYHEEKTLSPLRDAQGRITHFIASGRDISARMQVQEHLSYLAHHDALTGLPNRMLFTDLLNRALARARRHQRMVAVMFIDLDHFKQINDTLGHEIGDQVLQEIAKRLTECVRSSDVVARFGGDEFAILLEDVVLSADVVPVARKILDRLAHAVELQGNRHFLTASIGMSLFPNDGEDVPTLLRHADAAMYRAKEQGRATYQYYTPHLQTTRSERSDRKFQLDQALKRGEFVLHYQPQAGITGGDIGGIEALLRWHHPQRGLLTPPKFIPLLEDSGLIVPVGIWVLHQACTQAQTWRKAGYRFSHISVNLSARQFKDPALAESLHNILKETGLPPGYLELEINEGVLMQDFHLAMHTLRILAKLGVRLAVDNFGTGHASLINLQQLPLRTLKIDHGFVQDAPGAPQDATLTAASIALGHSLGLKVVAEGVETLAQLEFLRQRHCDAFQGYYFSRPLEAEAMTTFLSRPMSSINAPPLS